MTKWPFPGDSAVARARRIATMYRQYLLDVDPDGCAFADKRARELGEGWAAPKPLTWDLDDWITAKQAADELFVSVGAVRKARARGSLAGEEIRPGVWHYKVRDVLQLIEQGRRK